MLLTASPITGHSRWIRKQIPIEVEVTRFVTYRTVSFIALDKTFSGTLPHWLVSDFTPVTERKKKGR